MLKIGVMKTNYIKLFSYLSMKMVYFKPFVQVGFILLGKIDILNKLAVPLHYVTASLRLTVVSDEDCRRFVLVYSANSRIGFSVSPAAGHRQFQIFPIKYYFTPGKKEQSKASVI